MTLSCVPPALGSRRAVEDVWSTIKRAIGHSSHHGDLDFLWAFAHQWWSGTLVEGRGHAEEFDWPRSLETGVAGNIVDHALYDFWKIQ